MTSTTTPPGPTIRWVTAAAQRQALDGLADLIEKHYVFPSVADVCADGLRRRPVRSSGLSSSALARELTAQLRTHDRHFAVTWGAPSSLIRSVPQRDADSDSAMSLRAVGGIGILAVSRFDDAMSADAAALADDCLTGLEHCDAAIVDVRGNPGGWPSMTEHLLSAFLGPDAVHVLTFTRRGEPARVVRTRPRRPAGRLADIPLVALVDERTASAAESLTYTLQSTGRAVIVGRRTAGAANPVESFADRSGFHVLIPTGAPVDPRTGTNWDQNGITPDVVVGDADHPLARALAEARRLLR
ncbi:S41 family peptidase [Microbacterium sp.]|uniref:S41 family peptidase n=1 Tax=Microbacterium sp. TaxID=51671 RepID=UPI002811F2CF|nr:S41 family peptidase [Microbacterium sp.]